MKVLNSLFLAAGMLFLSSAMISCSDENDPDYAEAAQVVEGSYTDNLELTVMSSTSVYENVTFKIVAVTDETVDIIMPSYGEGTMVLPEITVHNVKVSLSNNGCVIATTSYSESLDNGREASGSIAGTYENGKLTLQFSLLYGNMPFEMIGYFEGSKDK